MKLEDEKRELIKKCLSGTASDSELHQYEKLMQDESNNISDLAESLAYDQGDSFIETIHQFSTADTDKISKLGESDQNLSQSLSRLVDRIQQMVPQNKSSKLDLERILSETSHSESLGRIGRFEVVEFLASGGMGLVFKAIDPTLNRFVCIKVLNPNLKSNADAKTRFERETKSAAQLRSDRIVMVLEVGEHRELPYFVMQLLDGGTLRSKINSGTIATEMARQFVIQIAEGLRHAHSLGILHRDIKPENIWITPENNIKLLDFGLAQVIDDSEHLTHSGTIIGTPAYMSPEQVHGKSVDERSDLFSVGVIFYEMQTGISPFVKPNLFSTLMSVVNDEVDFGAKENSAGPNCEFSPIIKSLLEKKPADRIQSADELIERLDYPFESVSASRVVSVENSNSTKGQPRTPKLEATKIQVATVSPPSILSRLIFGFAGAAIMLLALLIYQSTDKGTLVVEASSEVEVHIKNEVVKIVDPQNGKKYEIRIGANPLPSGVYQLESTQPDSDLVFSSNVITIRRGAKQLVKVELKPSNPKPLVASKDKVDGRPKTAADENAKKQNRPKQFELSDLTKLDKKQLYDILEFSTERTFFKNGIVSKPPKLANLNTWTIEPAKSSTDGKCPISVSEDGKKFALADTRDWIRIWSDKFELIHLIPSIGTTSQIEWSGDGKHLIAICESNGKKKIILWRIEEKFAQVVRVIPTIGERLSWTESGRYIVVGVSAEKKVEIHDLMPSIPTKRFVGIIGDFQDAAESGGAVLIASIHDGVGQMMNADSQNVEQVMVCNQNMQFLTKHGSAPILIVRNQEGLKYWDTAAKKMQRQIVFGEDDLAVSVASNGTHVIDVSVDGQVRTSNVQTKKSSSFQIPVTLSENWLRYMRGKLFSWSRDSSTVVLQLGTKVHIGKLSESSEIEWSTEQLNPDSLGWLREVKLLDGEKLFYTLARSDDGGESYYYQNGIYHPDGKTFLNNEKFRRWIQLASPNGKWLSAHAAFIATPENRGGKLKTDRLEFNVYSFNSGKLEHQIELPVAAYGHYWSSDSRHILIQRQKTSLNNGSAIIIGKMGDSNFKNAEYVYSMEDKKLLTLIPPDGYHFAPPASVELFGSESQSTSGEIVKLVFRRFSREERRSKSTNTLGTYGLARYSLADENCVDVIDLPHFKTSPKLGADEKHIWVYGTPSETNTRRKSDDSILVTFFEHNDINASPVSKEFPSGANSGIYHFHFPFYTRTLNGSSKLGSLFDPKKRFDFNQAPRKIGDSDSSSWHNVNRNQLINFRKYSSEIEYFNAATNSSSVRKHPVDIVGVNSTPTGWQIADSFGLTDVDFTGVIQKFRFTHCAIDDETQTPLDLWITADGKYARRKDADKFYTAVLLRGGRFETRTIAEFEKEFQLKD